MNGDVESEKIGPQTGDAPNSASPPPLPVQRAFPGLLREPLPADAGILAVADALLKSPGAIMHEVLHRNHRVRLCLLGLVLASTAAYGLTMGSFSGGIQLWAVPLKTMGMVLFSALLCLPSLYILTALGGGERNLTQVAGILLQVLGLTSLLLLGFAPIVWIFSQSTSSIGFMGALHMVFWGISLAVGLRLLFKDGNAGQSGRPTGMLGFWCVVFCAVLLQMGTVLRPLIGPADRVLESGKKFFIVNIGETLAEAPHERR